MQLRIRKSEILGKVEVPSSKSYTHRAFALAMLADGESRIRNPLLAADTLASLDACRAFGCEIEKRGKEMIFCGTAGELEEPSKIIDVKNSGTTLRLFSAIAGLDTKVKFTGDQSILRRPMGPLLNALEQLGCRTKSVNGYPPVQINGRIQGGIVKIPGDISSQFISGLLIACPYATQDTEIVLTSDLVSKPYVDLTLECVKKFEGEIKNLYYEQFFIPGEQCYRSKRYDVEGDWSSGSFLLAAGVIAGQVTVKNLNLNSKQGDRAILDILKQMGAEISVDVGITAKKSELKGIEIDAKNFPDLVPVLAILGCYAKGETIIKNVEHARLKECDRIRASYTELRKMGANIEEKKDGLIVRESKLKGTILDSYKDHRMVLALSVGALGAEGETIIKDAEVVDVSFPNFVNIMQKLGANIK